MKKKLVGLASLAVVSAMVLSSCNSGGNDGGSSSNDEVTLTMVESLTNPNRVKVLRSILDDFEKENKGIKVNLVSPPTEQADNKIQQMLQSGKGVDVLEVRDLTVGSFSNNDWLVDMADDLQNWDGWDNLTENTTKNTVNSDGKAYFIPYGFYGLSLFYRKDLVEKAGFDAPPKSWDEMLKQAEKIQKDNEGKYGYAFRGGTNANSPLSAMIEAYVGEDLDPDSAFYTKNGDTIFGTDAAKKAVKTYFDLYEKASPRDSISWGYPEMVEGFNNGSTAFLLQDPEVIAALEESTQITKDQWTTAPLLTGPSGMAAQPVATAGWGIAEASEHKDEALKLIKFLSSGDAPIEFAKNNSLVPILKGADEDKYYKTGAWESYLAMSGDLETYVPVTQPRFVPWWTEWSQMADADIQSLLLGNIKQEEMLKKWDEYWVKKKSDI